MFAHREMETFRLVIVLAAMVPFAGIAIYSVASLFYLLPRFGEGLTRDEVLAAIPGPLRRFGSICMKAFLGLFVFGIVGGALAELCVRFFHASPK